MTIDSSQNAGFESAKLPLWLANCIQLATQGFLNENGRPFAAASVKSMLVLEARP